jgi:hypothetical protein
MVNSEVRKTFEDPKFGRRSRNSAETTFHAITDGIGAPRFVHQMSGVGPAMILLPKILPKVTDASVDTLDKFLQVVQDHPLLKYADPTDKMYDLYQAAAAASEKFLGPELFRVSDYFHPHNCVAHRSFSFVRDWGSVARYVKRKLLDWPQWLLKPQLS